MSTEAAQQAALDEARAQGRREGLAEASEHLRLSGWVVAMVAQGTREPIARASLTLLASSLAQHSDHVRAERFMRMTPEGKAQGHGHVIEWESLRTNAPEILAHIVKQALEAP